MAISEKVWRKGWQREAADTQVASAELAGVIAWLEQRALHDTARIVRETAMKHGARAARDDLESAIAIMTAKRRTVP